MKNPNTNTILECDIVSYNEDDSIFLMIEYDGRQHSEPVDKFGGEQALLETQERDRIKNELLSLNKDKYEYFIRFNFKDTLTIENIKNVLVSSGISIES